MKKALALVLLMAACTEDPVAPPPSDVEAQVIAPRLGVVLAAVGVASQGRGFLDNFIPCGRRGIINFHNKSAAIREAEFSSCDVGGGVVIDGKALVEWSGTRNQPVTGPTSISVSGDLFVTLNGKRVRIGSPRVNNLRFTTTSPNFLQLVADSLQVEISGFSYRSTGGITARSILDPTGITLQSIPNPASSLSVLTTADLKRLAFDAGSKLGAYLATNVRQENPGPIAIQNSCGVTHVGYDAQSTRTFFIHEWQNCDMDAGMLVSGSFHQRLVGPFQVTTSLPMVIDGTITLGGAIPTITLTRFEWTITIPQMPGTARFEGLLRNAVGDQRSFSFNVFIDD